MATSLRRIKIQKPLAFTSRTDRHIQHYLDNLCNRPTERSYCIRGYIQSDRRPVLNVNYIADNHAGDMTDCRALHWNCNDWPTNRALQYEITVNNRPSTTMCSATTDRAPQCAVQRPTKHYNVQCNDRPTDRPTEHYSTQCTHRDWPTDRTTVMKTNSMTATNPRPAR